MLATILLSFALASLAVANIQFLGVAIAGGDFGCQINGNCPTSMTELPLKALGFGDGQGQMHHFVQDDQMNMFRLPVSWQFLGNNRFDGPLDATNLAKYDQVMQACLATGAYCMIDVHNFARWNGAVIGQGGPTDDQFAALWAQLATKYAAASKVVFELMNEPHHLDLDLWVATCQKAVAAIRAAGATSQMILLPGTNFDSAATLVSSSSQAALLGRVRNPDGSTDKLLLDVHKYLDEDNSGTHALCTTDNVAALDAVAQALRQAGRQAIVSETGASRDASCLAALCAQNAFINANSDVFVGLVMWAAGSFGPDYLLGLTPTKNGQRYEDNALLKTCVLGTCRNSSMPSPPPPPALSSPMPPAPTPPPPPATLSPSAPSPNQSLPTGTTDMFVSMPTSSINSLLVDPGTPTPRPGCDGGAVPTGVRNGTPTGTGATAWPTVGSNGASTPTMPLWAPVALAAAAVLFPYDGTRDSLMAVLRFANKKST